MYTSLKELHNSAVDRAGWQKSNRPYLPLGDREKQRGTETDKGVFAMAPGHYAPKQWSLTKTKAGTSLRAVAITWRMDCHLTRFQFLSLR